MGWHDLAYALTDIPQLFQRNDDDLYDRISHRWTTVTLIMFAVLTSTSQYVGDPVHCWVPAHFKGGWEKYTNNYCWVKNTYNLPFEQNIPKDLPHRERREIVYYQWVPLILMAQALMFYFPIVVWRTMNDRTGVDMNDVIETAEKVQRASDLESKDRRLVLLCKQTHRYLGVTANPPKNRFTARWILTHCFCVCCGTQYGNYVTALYILIKLMFLVNIFSQMWMLNALLGQNFADYGIDVIKAMINGEDWTFSDRFPRVTMCDLNVRRLGNNHRYSVQCVLTINFFNEKIYLYLWFWFILVAVLTILGLLLLLARVFFRTDAENYIRGHLEMGGVYRPSVAMMTEREVFDRFVHRYLRQDGVLLMRLVGHNTNKVTVNELICTLWEHYKSLPHVRKGLEDGVDGGLRADDADDEKSLMPK